MTVSPRPKVLVIDDEHGNLRVFQRVFRARFEVSVADSWARAEELLASGERPDIAFVDLCMPKVDGLEVLARLRDLAPGVARYLLTGYGDIPEAVAAMQNGLCLGILAKPWERSSVEAVVTLALGAR